jgi:hypothetical protein
MGFDQTVRIAMSNCKSNCPTQDHASYGECLRDGMPSTRNSTQSVDSLYKRELVNYTEITEYKAARAQGIQPKGSKLKDIRTAVAASKATDTALTLT